MNTDTISEILGCMKRMKSCGVQPDTILMTERVYSIIRNGRRIKGNAKARKRIRFFNKKYCAKVVPYFSAQ